MPTLIIIGFVIFIIYIIKDIRKQPVNRIKDSNPSGSRKTEQKTNHKVNQNHINPQKIIENKNKEQTENIKDKVLNTNHFETKMSNLDDGKNQIVQKLIKEVGGITELSIETTKNDIKLFLAPPERIKKSSDYLSIEIEVDKDSNFIIINSSNKDNSPLRKGEKLTIYFEDNSFIEKKFGVSRIQIGENVRNIVAINDLELAKLGRSAISYLETSSSLKIPFEFSDTYEQNRNSNNLEGKILFQKICNTIYDTKLILKNFNNSITLSLKTIYAFASKSNKINNLKAQSSNLNSIYNLSIHDKNIEQTEIIHRSDVNSNIFKSKIETRNIFDTEASVVKELSNEVGKITKLAGQTGNGEIKFYLALEDWKKELNDFLPTLSIELKIDKNSNFIIVNSSNKVISPLKKGNLFSIHFEDGSFIQKKFEFGRIQSGINVSNIIFLNDFELVKLSQSSLSHLETFNGLKIPYELTENDNEQYSNSWEEKKLFQIICEKLIELKSILSNSNNNLISSPKTVITSPISCTHNEHFIVSSTTEEIKKIEIGKILLSLLEHKSLNDINSFSEVKIDDSIIDVTDEIFEMNSCDNLPIFQNSINSRDFSIDNNAKIVDSEIQNPQLLNEQSENSIQVVSEIKEDDSIIDVTEQSYRINTNNNLKKYAIGVPYWAHQYVYSHSELNSASSEQKLFYNIFKTKFLNGEYFDLEGNTNYAFILLFDLQNDYENHKDISKLERQLKNLGQYYPKTKSYGNSILIQKMRLKGENENSYSFSYNTNSIDYETFNWINKYKTKLNLDKYQENLLSRIWFPNNNFSNIEHCCIEIIKLYIAAASELKIKYELEGTTIEDEFSLLADIIARKHFNYRSGSQNYKYCIQSTINTFYSTIFKHCENAVRESYGHKRKLNTETYYTNEEAKSEFDSKITSNILEIISNLISTIIPPDEATEIQLNALTTSRWKIKFEQLTANFQGNSSAFVKDTINLGKINKKNPSIENIFFEASKFMAKYDNIASLTLYVHYLYHDLKSPTFDNKKFTKAIQKSLFKTNDQLHDFEQIVSELINDKNLDKAVNAIPKIYEVKRKKIQLDRTTIKEVQQQLSGTVELLNEYLRDEFEDENTSIQSKEISSDEIKIKITRKKEESSQSIFLSELSLNPTHISVLELFSKNNFSMPQIEIEEFAKSKGIFKNQLIESINEVCYEVLDDVLIEEEDDYYTIIPDYFQKIQRNDR